MYLSPPVTEGSPESCCCGLKTAQASDSKGGLPELWLSNQQFDRPHAHHVGDEPASRMNGNQTETYSTLDGREPRNGSEYRCFPTNTRQETKLIEARGSTSPMRAPSKHRVGGAPVLQGGGKSGGLCHSRAVRSICESHMPQVLHPTRSPKRYVQDCDEYCFFTSR